VKLTLLLSNLLPSKSKVFYYVYIKITGN